MADTRHKLVHAVTEFDRRQSRKPGYNIYALPQYLGRVHDVLAEVDNGKSLARALYDNFNDRLLTTLEKACGLPVTYGGGKADTGRPD